MRKPNYTVSALFDKRTILKGTKLSPIILAVSSGELQFRVGLKIYATFEDYQRALSIKGGSDEVKILRKDIHSYVEKAERILERLPELNRESFQRLFKSETDLFASNKTDVILLFNEKIAELNIEERISTAKLYQLSLKSFLKYSSPLYLEDINVKFLKGYKNWMIAQGNSSSTAQMYLRHLKAITNKAIKEGYISDKHYPFENYTIGISAKSKDVLYPEQIKVLWNYQPVGIRESRAKDFFFFCYLSNGMNFKDVCFLKYRDLKGDILSFVREKTEQLLVGGVMASLLTKEIEIETGIKPTTGLLDQPGILDDTPKARELIIDNLPLDYSILDEIDYKYPTDSAYFTFMTKGCTRKCAFCSVPKLEPTYKPKIETIDKFWEIKTHFGEQQNLLLMDNNVLASPKFPEIIQEIKDMGFVNGATYIEPNQLKIAILNLRSGYNDRAYVKRSFKLIHVLLSRLRGKSKQEFYNLLEEFELLHLDTTTKENLLKANKLIAPYYEKHRPKIPKQRYVDFNQGTDARYVTDELMKLMSEIPIKPLRIAFDYVGLKNTYIAAVELAAKYGIKELSNYILYNFNDSPHDLYERLKINVELGERLGIHIYSFPMKYIPLFGEEAKDREFVGKKWNKKFIRAIQSILNVTKGIVAPGRSFFEKAFGKNIDEFYDLLFMPETYIVYRYLFERALKYTPIWKSEYESLTSEERIEAQQVIIGNDFTNLPIKTNNLRVQNFLRHYTVPRGSIERNDPEYRKLKLKFEKMIKNNRHHNLTLTYDFEATTARKKHSAVIR
jgi:hypothetical protein